MRLDKFLWCVRLYKTRSIATEACRAGRVKCGGLEARPAHDVKPGDKIAVRTPPIWRSFDVLALPPSRVGAALVPGLIRETTSFDDLEKQEIARKVKAAHRGPGAGRPTKRERRDMDRFTEG